MDNLPSQNVNSTHSSTGQDHREWIGGRIFTLLGHFWRDDDPAKLTSAIAADWVGVLVKFPRHAIARACTEYLRSGTSKPKPADIVRLASRYDGQKSAGQEFAIDPDTERQCMMRIDDGESYDTWPRDHLKYLIAARGAGDVKDWAEGRKGWFRPGGPNDRLGGKTVTDERGGK